MAGQVTPEHCVHMNRIAAEPCGGCKRYDGRERGHAREGSVSWVEGERTYGDEVALRPERGTDVRDAQRQEGRACEDQKSAEKEAHHGCPRRPVRFQIQGSEKLHGAGHRRDDWMMRRPYLLRRRRRRGKATFPLYKNADCVTGIPLLV